MDGFELKRSVVATFERIHQFNTDQRLESLEVLWHGETAGIRWESKNNAKLFLPAIDERKNFPKSMLFKLVGFVIHELGHLWYTDAEVWDKAVEGHSPLLHRLINGLEDPRIELEVINSHRAANARTLLESLTQSMLAKNPDYIEADDIENYPFLLAVEGRRLNGYSIPVPNIIPQSPDAKALTVALNDAHYATSTAEIVEIAKRLFDAIQKRKKKPKGKPEEKKEGKPGDSEEQMRRARRVSPPTAITVAMAKRRSPSRSSLGIISRRTWKSTSLRLAEAMTIGQQWASLWSMTFILIRRIYEH
jgi:hypothetical protein